MEASSESVPHAVPRRRIGGYEVVASLGRGGAGEAFLALTANTRDFRKLVVLKLLHPELEESIEVVDQFLDEARLAARLSHPNVVPTLEVGRHETQHYIAMAYLEGMPLGRVLSTLAPRGERVAPEIAARIAVDLLDALAYAHALRDFDGTPLEIVHRDVSPPNVFVCWDGSVKLLDFGIARAASRRASTDSGLIKGKFGYIAPEQASGEGTDRRADLWSVGVVLWEMLTGHRLFPARNDVGTLHALVAGTITPVTTHAPDTPPGLVTVLEQVLRRDPDERYRSAEEMRDVLQAWLDARPREVTRDDVAAWLGDAFAGERERQQALLRECIGGARLSASATGSFHVAPQGPSTESFRVATKPPPEPEKPRLAWGPIAFAAIAMLTLVGIVWRGTVGGEPPPIAGTRTGASVGARGAETTTTQGVPPTTDEGGSTAASGSSTGPSPGPTSGTTTSGTTSATTSAATTASSGSSATSVTSSGAEGSATSSGTEGSATEGAGARPATRASATQDGTTRTRGEGDVARDAPGGSVSAPSATAEPPEDTSDPATAEPREEELAVAAPGVGWLSLDATPWAEVSLDGRSLGHTPLMRLELPAGEHELVLENPERGIRRVYVVRVRPGETIRRRIAF